MLKCMMGFLMVNGLSQVDSRRGLQPQQLPALKQSLAKVVSSFSLGATRNQAVGKIFTNIALGFFVFSFLAFPSLTYAQNPIPSVVTETVKTIDKTAKELKPSSIPNIPSPSPIATPPPQAPETHFQLPHPGYITTTFSAWHPGIDLCIGLGMPIKPIDKGVVTEAGYNIWGYGLMVEVDHGNGYKSLYAHMKKIYVTKGKEVGTGDLLGEVGMTGHTTGPHTHLELSYYGRKIDPRPLLPEIRNYPKDEDFVTHDSATPSAISIPVATTSANIYTGIVENMASQSADEDKEKEEAEKRITTEKISDTILNSLLATPSSEIKEATVSFNLTDQLPTSAADYTISSELEEKDFRNILSLSMHQAKNTEAKEKFETMASENLTSMLAKTNPELAEELVPTPEPTQDFMLASEQTNKIEELAGKKLETLLSKTNPQLNSLAEKVNLIEEKPNGPIGGEISFAFNLNTLFGWK